jgi:hypothetical protein
MANNRISLLTHGDKRLRGKKALRLPGYVSDVMITYHAKNQQA